MVMEPGNSSRRHEAFPEGLRVLVVDDDPTWLKILEKMLKKCSYEVTTCGLARDALNLLRERKDGYDIVISDVNMPDMDGFKLLEHVGLEMDLPVIMMSVDGETSRVMKGVQHGACDYLLKPIRMKELRNIWQHVLRKRIHEGRDIDSHESFDGLQMTRSGSDRLEEFFYCGEDISSGKKRKESENKHDDRDFCDSGSSTKKARVVWSVDLHQKFVKAVNQIGFDKVGPKRILDLMNVPWLTRENVASHLQKYRLYLTRLQKENDSKASFSGIKSSDATSQEPTATFSAQNSISLPQEDIAASRNFAYSGNNFLSQSTSPKVHEVDHKAITPILRESKRSLTPVITNQHESRGMKVGYKPPIVQPAPEDMYPVVGPKAHCSWRGVPEVTFKEETDPHIHLEDLGHLLKPVNERPHLTEARQTKSIEQKPLCADNRSNNTVQTRPEKEPNDFLGIPDKGNIVNYQVPQSIPVTLSSIHSESFDLGTFPAPVSDPGSLTSISGSIFEPSHGELQVGWLQDDPFCTNLGLNNSDFSGYDNPCLIAEVPVHLYDTLRFDYEQYMDPTECSIIDHGLFIT